MKTSPAIAALICFIFPTIVLSTCLVIDEQGRNTWNPNCGPGNTAAIHQPKHPKIVRDTTHRGQHHQHHHHLLHNGNPGAMRKSVVRRSGLDIPGNYLCTNAGWSIKSNYTGPSNSYSLNDYFNTFCQSAHDNELGSGRSISLPVQTVNGKGREFWVDFTYVNHNRKAAQKPGLPGLAQDLPAQVVNTLSDDDQNKGNGIHPVDGVFEDLDADHNAPEITGEKTDVEKRGGRQAKENGGERVEDEQAEGVAGEIAADLAVPDGVLEGAAVEDGGLHAHDDGGVEAELAEHLVQGPLADKVLLGDVGEAVEGGAEQGEQVALELVAAGLGGAATAGAGEVVGAEQHAHAADADDDAQVLGPVVADAQEEEGERDDDDDGPEVDELGAEDGGVAVGEDDEVVALDVADG
ncbi:hypothetical protein LOZ12_005183 [Ophidiomyces ophidiicola]|uniref:Uncharacterized protein n=1 Tax=Ophidiomyces ophidiicola TaxID=1387563 RepID=A0ACB8UVS5_9EURO|nr:hypothetical protein LOZ64_001445 [Ophidiomyces ophidiicola]KAI1946285.1 hypothetical protein LOZ62_003395 [Ophidiomyces ophidiicola]KAI1971390.1 hypothetical protein LOZ56_003090 [Ophidiomyces ophidiicola]KAI2001753.1 hypothetical protein LOZ50_005453 [Ophidiomyces ophidiicola]KAI2030671.1 hypothetical protein LOZ45_001453 [Ophidiomyces ophidiicola]